MAGKKIVLIDGHSILTRAFFGVPDLTNSEGLHTNAIYGFLNIMFKIIDEEAPEYLFVAFDKKAPTFRHQMYAAYKGTRKPMPEELHQQVPVIQELLAAMKIKVLTMEGYEADDILGTVAFMAERAGFAVTVVSGDRDLLQLATERILIRIPKTKKNGTEIEDYYAKDVEALYGVTPKQFIDMKALMGDTADNIPGVKSIGEKTASKLIAEYQSVEAIYDQIENIQPERVKNALIRDEENARLSKVLATIDIQAPVTLDIEDCKIMDLFNPDSYDYIKRLGFKSFLGKFEGMKEAEIPDFRPMEKAAYCRTKEKLLELKKEISDSSLYAGIAVSFENGLFPAIAAVSLGDQVVFVEAGEELQVSDLKDFAVWLGESGNFAAVFDLKQLLKQIPMIQGEIFDCVIAAYLLNPLAENYQYDSILSGYLGIQVKAETELIGKQIVGEAFAVSREAALEVLALRAAAASLSAPVLREKLEQTGMLKLYTEVEYPLIFVLDSMEREGVRIDEQALKDYGEELGSKIKELEQQIFEETGEEFNLNSPKQLGVILFEKLGIPGGKKTKTGYSTNAEILEKLAPEYPVISKILEYRQLAKLKSTYADGLVNQIGSDGRIHGTFNQTITATGRISSTDPNLQNIPIRMEMGKKIREVFIPKDGYLFVDADYSQIELRLLAHMSGDENLIRAYNSEQDIHKITASQVFHVPMEEVTPQLRRNAKAVNFGIVYGISSFGLSQDLSISKKEAASYIEHYFETYPKVKEFLDRTVANAKKDGYTVTLFGRRRPIPELKSSNFMQRSFGERAAMNSAVQGTAADIMKIAMIRVSQRLKEENLQSKIILQVHDELLIETPPEEKERVKEIVSSEMAAAAELKVALEVGIEDGKNWLEAH